MLVVVVIIASVLPAVLLIGFVSANRMPCLQDTPIPKTLKTLPYPRHEIHANDPRRRTKKKKTRRHT